MKSEGYTDQVRGKIQVKKGKLQSKTQIRPEKTVNYHLLLYIESTRSVGNKVNLFVCLFV